MEQGMRESDFEWRVVRRRGVGRPVSERLPARQSYFPSRRFTLRQQTVDGRDGKRSNDVQRNFNQREVTQKELSEVGETFFFNNFPKGCWLETLKRKFNEVGKVIDIYRPKKRDIKGKPFGFVRFEGGVDYEQILSNLNNIWIGSYKLRAFVPRFERPALADQMKTNENSAVVEAKKGKETEGGIGKSFQIISSRRTNGRSFAEALSYEKPGKCPCQREDHTEEKLSFRSSDIEKAWLKEAFTGSLQSDFLWEEIQEELNSECGSSLKLTYMGGSLILIQSLGQSSLQELLREMDEWTSFWFEWTRPWKPSDVNVQRVVWTRWSGIPLHAWNQRFFDFFGARLGTVLKVHEDTILRNHIDVAVIQISTGLEKIDRVIECEIDDGLFKIKVEEVLEQVLDSSNYLDLLESDTDSEDFTEDEERSAFPAKATAVGDPAENPDSNNEDVSVSKPGAVSGAVHLSDAADFTSPQKDLLKEDSFQSLAGHAQSLVAVPPGVSQRRGQLQSNKDIEEQCPNRIAERPSPSNVIFFSNNLLAQEEVVATLSIGPNLVPRDFGLDVPVVKETNIERPNPTRSKGVAAHRRESGLHALFVRIARE